MATASIVRVEAVESGGEGPVGYVDTLPLVNQMTSEGVTTPHGTLHHLPYFRMQGGENAIICDPKVGDIGLAVFASRDISVVKTTKTQSQPGSFRRFDMADGCYFGGFLNGTPTQWVEFTEDGLNVTDKNGNSIVMGPDGILITDKTGNTINMSAMGIHTHDAVADTTIGSNTHSHMQPNDSHGDTEAPTLKPTDGT